MTQAQLEILTSAFIRLFRSYGLVLQDTSPRIDVTEPERVLAIWKRERKAVDRLGAALFRLTGRIETGHAVNPAANVHFLNLTNDLPRWRREHAAMTADLEKALAALGMDSTAEGAEELTAAVAACHQNGADLASLAPLPVPV
jgi:hypothetical protein